MDINSVQARMMAAGTQETRGNIQPQRKSDLSIDDFLKIMAAEISNQSIGGDSGSKTDYISQLAQFTTLEQMGQITQNLDILSYMGQQQYAFSLIGKEVLLNAIDGDEVTEITGVVEKVKFENGIPVVVVNGETHYISSITEVGMKGSDEIRYE